MWPLLWHCISSPIQTPLSKVNIDQSVTSFKEDIHILTKGGPDCIRILKPGGVFGASTWPKATADMFWIPDMRTALESLPFDAPMPDPVPMQIHHSGRWDDAAWVERHLAEDLGLTGVSVRESEGEYRFESADEFMATFHIMVQWLMNTFWSDEVRERHSAEEVKALVKRHLEEKYGGKGWSIRWRVICMTATVAK